MQAIVQLLAQLRTAPPPGTHCHSALTLPATPPPCQPLPEHFPAWLTTLLQAQGIAYLTEAQGHALHDLAQGHHICLMAPSGRQLFRMLAMYQDPELAQQHGHTLYIFPYKDRQQAQIQAFHTWNAQLPAAHRLDIAIYDGDTPRTQRLAIRQSLPHLVCTTPEMLHAGILPYHGGWRALLQGLRYVVLADIHRYNGALLSHMAHVLRRLQRLMQHYGAQPRYVLTSAPLANMAEIAYGLTAHTCRLVSGTAWQAHSQSRVVLESSRAPVALCRDVIAQHQAAGLQPLVFVPQPFLTRLAAGHAEPSWATCPAHVTADEYRMAELRLLRGQCHALFLAHETASATIHPIALSSSVFLGLPPSLLHLHTHLTALASTSAPSINTLVLSGNTPIERFLLRHPTLYHAPWEQSMPFVLRHPQLIRRHVHCATAEMAFRAGESYAGFPDIEDILQQLATQQAVTYRATAKAWSILAPQPHRYLRLRTYEPAWTMVQATDEQMLARIPPVRAFRECFPGAICVEADRTWQVERSLPERRRIVVRPVQAAYNTRGLLTTTVPGKTITASVTEDGFQLTHGMIEYTETLSAYERLHPHTLQRQSVHLLPATQRHLHTAGTWMTLSATTAMPLLDLQSAAHTVIHAVLAALPLLCLQDHDALQAGVYPSDTTDSVDVVFLDAHPGGNGLSHTLYQQYERVLRIGLHILLQCDCLHGYQGCIGAVQCNTCSSTIPYDRQQGIRLLQRLLGEVVPDFDRVAAPAASSSCLYLVLTTQKSVEEVGGWQHKHLLGLGVAMTYDTNDQRYRLYTAATVDDLLASLQAAALVIGFNTRDFDYQILQPYTTTSLTALPTLAILDHIHRILGFRLSFRHVLKATLDIDRPDDSLQNLQWYQEGERERIAHVCRRDLDLLRQLIDYGNTQGVLFYRDQVGTRRDFPVSWQQHTTNLRSG